MNSLFHKGKDINDNDDSIHWTADDPLSRGSCSRLLHQGVSSKSDRESKGSSSPAAMGAAGCLLLVVLLAKGNEGQQFKAHDCSKPRDVRMLSHQQCKINTNHGIEKEYLIIQHNTKRKIEGYSCALFVSEHIDYCGHYSSTKANAESSYHIPTLVDSNECYNMVHKQQFHYMGQTIEVHMNQVNLRRIMLLGSIKYTGTNIECTGQKLRMSNGQITDNMIKQIELQIIVQKVELMVDGDEVYKLTGEQIGREADGEGKHNLQTVIWDKPNPRACHLAVVARMKLTTTDQKHFFSSEHMVQFTRGDRAFSERCSSTYWTTTDDNIYLMEEGSNSLEKFNQESVQLYSQFQTQIEYLNSKISRSARGAYKMSRDPECASILYAPLHRTIKLPTKRFTRNLGDCSIVFSCPETTVRPSNATKEGKCYVQPEVTTRNGETRYLDPETRILLLASTETACTKPTAPVIRDVTNKYYAFLPTPEEVFPSEETVGEEDDIEGSRGIYAQNVINEWLGSAYLQHIHQILTIGYEGRRGTGESHTASLIGQITQTYDKMKEAKENLTEIFNWDHIGAMAGIGAMGYVMIELFYKMIKLMIRIVLVYDKKKSYVQVLFQAGFGDLQELANRQSIIND